MQTNSANNPAGYDPASMASNFNYSKSGATDSASAATAMYTGVKNYDGTINWTTDSKPLTTFFEQAAQAGKAIGAVSSVQLSHATPGAVYGHNSSRNNYASISWEGVYGSNPLDSVTNNSSNSKAGNNGLYDALNYNGNLKVLMGAGNGDYTDNGTFDTSKTDNYVGGSAAWTDIKEGVPPNGWTLIESKSDFEKVATGTLNPDRVLGVAQVNTTLQQARTNPAGDFDPLNTNVPTLLTMTKAALNVLDNDPNGFTVMIEGGAVDWANHANQLDRMIEEQIDFNNSVKAVVDYLDANTNGNNWTNTLLIVTADHETGHLWGDGTVGFFDVNGNGTFDAGVDYAHVKDNGIGVLPGAKYNSGDHTNALVPLFAKGAGADLFGNYVEGTDPNLVALYGLDASWDGKFVDNTAIYHVMSQATGVVPIPAAVYLMGSALVGLIALRRRPIRA
jgi:alkaline phosphatase